MAKEHPNFPMANHPRHMTESGYKPKFGGSLSSTGRQGNAASKAPPNYREEGSGIGQKTPHKGKKY